MYNIKELTRKTAVVTGATSGIGFETARQLSESGAFVIGVGRSPERCKNAQQKIASASVKPVFLTYDLSSLKQVRQLAESIHKLAHTQGNGAVDLLINNAATVSSWYVNTEDGFELQFAVNHLAPFLLTHELLSLLKNSRSACVVTVSSGSHYRTRINWKDVMMRKSYSCLKAYKQSKLANVLFSSELKRRLGEDSGIDVYAADPGLVNTGIGLKGTSGIEKWVWKIRCQSGIPALQASRAIVYLACKPGSQHARELYWKAGMPKKPSRYSQRPDIARRLWGFSEKICGICSKDYGLEGG